MDKITFEDLPSTNTPINSVNLNQMQTNIEKSAVAISQTEPTTNENVWFQKGKNLIDLKKMMNSSLNESYGTLQADATRLVTPFIFLLAGTYTVSCNLSRFAYGIYNKDKIFNSFVTWNTFPNQIVIENDCYIRLEVIKDYNGSENVSIADISYLQLEQGSTATGYEAYVDKKILVKKNNGVREEFYNEHSVDEDTGWVDMSAYVNTAYFSIRGGLPPKARKKNGIVYWVGELYCHTDTGTNTVNLLIDIPSEFRAYEQYSSSGVPFATSLSYNIYTDRWGNVSVSQGGNITVQSDFQGFQLSNLSGYPTN